VACSCINVSFTTHASYICQVSIIICPVLASRNSHSCKDWAGAAQSPGVQGRNASYTVGQLVERDVGLAVGFGEAAGAGEISWSGWLRVEAKPSGDAGRHGGAVGADMSRVPQPRLLCGQGGRSGRRRGANVSPSFALIVTVGCIAAVVAARPEPAGAGWRGNRPLGRREQVQFR